MKPSSFPVTYGPVPRIWCPACDGFERLPDLTPATVQRLEGAHVCGPRTSA